jgi:hypothetical protein
MVDLRDANRPRIATYRTRPAVVILGAFHTVHGGEA